ncbi:MAG: hypothetical protein O3A51_02010 [Verrucomicrobia bacterium]|nr:hypothetical protein [Verrucomicrobiota bacterium]
MSAPNQTEGVKVKGAIQGTGKSAFRAYRDICYGRSSLAYVLKAECIMALTGSLPGAVGLFLRSKLYP